MILPIQRRSFEVYFEPRYGLKVGRLQIRTPLRSRIGLLMSPEELIEEVNRYRLLGVELLELAGEDGADIWEELIFVSKEGLFNEMRVRVETRGVSPDGVSRLTKHFGAISLVVGVPLSCGHTREQHAKYRPFLRQGEDLEEVSALVRQSLSIIDKTESSVVWIPLSAGPELGKEIKESLQGIRTPVYYRSIHRSCSNKVVNAQTN